MNLIIDHTMGDLHLSVDIRMDDSETLVVFGPNGAGKTTLLRLLAGTLPGGPSLDAAYLPQRPAALRGSAERNLHLGLSDDEVRRAEDLAVALGVGPLLDRRARSLSGGERQRVALARVLATDAPVVLLDEPLAPIDVADRRLTTAVINQHLADRAAVVVTHHRETVATVGDRVAVLIGGRVHQVASPTEALALPGSEAAAAALGVSNVIAGEVTEVDDGLLALESGPLVVWGIGEEPAIGRALFGGEAVTVFPGIHPDSGSARNTWTGTVTGVEPVGTLVELVVDCGPTVVALLTPGGFDGLGLGVGDTATLAVKATAVRIL